MDGKLADDFRGRFAAGAAVLAAVIMVLRESRIIDADTEARLWDSVSQRLGETLPDSMHAAADGALQGIRVMAGAAPATSETLVAMQRRLAAKSSDATPGELEGLAQIRRLLGGIK